MKAASESAISFFVFDTATLPLDPARLPTGVPPKVKT